MQACSGTRAHLKTVYKTNKAHSAYFGTKKPGFAPSRQIRPKKGLMGLKIRPVCPLTARSGLVGPTSRGRTGPSDPRQAFADLQNKALQAEKRT